MKTNHCLHSVTFGEITVPAREFDGELYVAMRPLVQALGLAWKPQYSMLKTKCKDVWKVIPVLLPTGSYRRMVVIPKWSVGRWAFLVDTRRIQRTDALEKVEELRAVLNEIALEKSKQIMLELRSAYIGQEYDAFPITNMELKIISDLMKEGTAIDKFMTMLCYDMIAPTIQTELTILKFTSTIESLRSRNG